MFRHISVYSWSKRKLELNIMERLCMDIPHFCANCRAISMTELLSVRKSKYLELDSRYSSLRADSTKDNESHLGSVGKLLFGSVEYSKCLNGWTQSISRPPKFLLTACSSFDQRVIVAQAEKFSLKLSGLVAHFQISLGQIFQMIFHLSQNCGVVCANSLGRNNQLFYVRFAS
ncbi:hypothetical protein BpHYR1_038046 [Brachionus plicatilis]|uniref:Uncharacterized protein n=1 Tax=Brachionus plicatilis TaxID=10195 RepID=A0A3M7P399_BRAPC|nr:hypothetical protein BpHYR1_038046 [Brachionus plicatilis]